MAEPVSIESERASYLVDLKARIDAVWPAGIPKEPNFAFGQTSVSDYLRGWSRKQGDAVAINYYGREISWRSLDDLSDSFAAFLADKGVGEGDRVAIFMPNCPQFTIAFHGILKLGAIIVPVNPMVRDAELSHYLDDSGASVAVTLDRLAPLVRRVKGEGFPILATALSEFLPETPALPVPEGVDAPRAETPGAFDFMQALKTPSTPGQFPSPRWDQPAALNYTGGTTGLPKGCIHTHGDMVYTGACTATFGVRADTSTVMLCYLPQFWIAGEVAGILMPLAAGCTVVLLVRWDALTVMTAIDKFGITGFGGVTDGIVEIMDHPQVGEFNLRSLKETLCSSFVKVVNAEYRARWLELTGSIARESSYGMTETNTFDFFTTGMQVDDLDLKSMPIFVGLPVVGTEVVIVDPDTGRVMPHGESGEILMRSPSVMKGYWGQRADLPDSPVRDGWFHTGDTGVIDPRGYMSFLGRRKEMLKVNGMSVFPSEVETLLLRNPAVASCGVVGRADAKRGQIPVAFVKLAPEAVGRETAETLEAWARQNMAVYKTPEIRLIDQMPTTDTGKVKRNALLEIINSETGA
jgi:long-chain acyl-CoA synthetase